MVDALTPREMAFLARRTGLFGAFRQVCLTAILRPSTPFACSIEMVRVEGRALSCPTWQAGPSLSTDYSRVK
jgi:hypothetical protein